MFFFENFAERIGGAPQIIFDICVTNGEIRTGPDGRLQIDSPSSRAVLRFRSQPAVEIRFTYLGSSAKSKPLASGELRRQFGIKLRAENTCNLVYAMWHIEPDSRLAVSIKRNPGMSTQEQCHAGGYINLQQSVDAPPKIVAGQTHTLRAELRGVSLFVSADGVEAGDVPLDVEKREAGVADMKVKRPSRFEQDVGSRGQLSPCALRGRPSEAEAAYGP